MEAFKRRMLRFAVIWNYQIAISNTENLITLQDFCLIVKVISGKDSLIFFPISFLQGFCVKAQILELRKFG